jgi:hypothetical protein
MLSVHPAINAHEAPYEIRQPDIATRRELRGVCDVAQHSRTAGRADAANERSRSRPAMGRRIAGREQEDWFQAERDLREARGGASASVRYHLVKDDAAVPR